MGPMERKIFLSLRPNHPLMKKNLLFFVAVLLLTPAMFAQSKDNVARECVLFELFTGVRCQYCPAAANAVAQMLEEGLPIAPVAYHTSAFSNAEYYNDETNARANYYAINSYPTLKADGVLSMSGGGNASQTNYSGYFSRYNQRIGVTSPFTIDLTVAPQSDGSCVAHCTVTQVGECSGSNIKVMMALTQCNIMVNWQGMHELHHVCRDMIPNQQGTSFQGPVMTIDEPFELNWPKEDCYLTAWVQSYSGTKEVYQAVRLSLNMDFDYDLALKDVDHYSKTNCSGMIQPTVTVKNLGNEEVHSFDVVAMVDGDEVYRESWNGALPVGENVEYLMNEFSMGDCSQLTLMVVDPNGHEDGFLADNKKSVAFDAVDTIDGYLKMAFRTDAHPEETTVQIQDMTTGEMVYEFTFDQPSHLYTEYPHLMNEGCYRIKVLDSAGNGLSGNAVFGFTDSNNHALFTGGAVTHFKDEMTFEVYCDGAWSVEESSVGLGLVWPNPSDGNFELSLGTGEWQVEVFDLTGRRLYQNRHFTDGAISLKDCGKGVYFLRATQGEEELVKKIMVY